MGLFSIIGDLLQATAAEDASAPVVTVGKGTITAGGLPNIVTAGEAVLAAILNVASGKGTVADAETIVNAILQGVEFVDPATAPVITLVIGLEPIAVGLLASGVIKPAANPIAEGQTTASDQTHGRYVGR